MACYMCTVVLLLDSCSSSDEIEDREITEIGWYAYNSIHTCMYVITKNLAFVC